MDPADIGQQLAACASRVDDIDHRMDVFAQAMQTILNRTAYLQPDTQGAAAPPASQPQMAETIIPASHVSMTSPIRFGGEQTGCRGFLTQVSIHFELNPRTYVSDRARIGFMINHMSDRALAWANPLWENDDAITYNYHNFIRALRRTFDPPGRSRRAGRSLLRVKQGSRSVADYAIEFKTLVAEVDWTNDCLCLLFQEGLSDTILDEIAAKNLPEDLEDLIDYTIDIDNRIRDRARHRERPRRSISRVPIQGSVSPPSRSLQVPDSEPMQLGHTRLSEEERTFRRREGLCLYCGRRGHQRLDCPLRPGNART